MARRDGARNMGMTQEEKELLYKLLTQAVLQGTLEQVRILTQQIDSIIEKLALKEEDG